MADNDFPKNQNQNDESYKKPNLPIKSRVSKMSNDALNLEMNIEYKQTHLGNQHGNIGKCNITKLKNLSGRKNFSTPIIPLVIENERNKNEFCDYDEPMTPPRHVLDKSNLFSIPENSVTIQHCAKTKLTELL